jgi:hypothetical protein
VLDGPFSRDALELVRVVHEHGCYLCVLGVFWFRRAEEGLKGEEGGFDCKDWRPGRADCVEANGTLGLLAGVFVGRKRVAYCLAADIWMPQLSGEGHSGRTEGIFIGNLNIDDVCSTFIWSVGRPRKGSPQVGKVGTTCWFTEYVGLGVTLDVLKLFGYSSYAV